MKHTDNERIDALSAAVDALNRGHKPETGDEEAKALAEVALLVKQAGPPPAAVAGLVATLGDELAARKKRRRLWLASGTAGTAAAAALVFVLNIGPPAAPAQPQLTIPPAGSVVIESLPVRETAPGPAAETAKADQGQEAAVAKRPAQPAKDTAPAPPVEDRPAAAAADGNAAPRRAMLAKGPEKLAERAADKAAPAFLSWPGHQPDTVTVDKATAIVRQVYGHGDGAIVITQRAAGNTAANGPAAFGAAQKANRVSITVKDIVVTVEGNLPEDELAKIARALE